MSKVCLDGCLKSCDIPRNTFLYSDILISHRFPNRYYTDTNHISYQTDTDTDISFILYFELNRLLSHITDTGIGIANVNRYGSNAVPLSVCQCWTGMGCDWVGYGGVIFSGLSYGGLAWDTLGFDALSFDALGCNGLGNNGVGCARLGICWFGL